MKMPQLGATVTGPSAAIRWTAFRTVAGDVRGLAVALAVAVVVAVRIHAWGHHGR